MTTASRSNCSFDNVPEHLVIPFDAVKGFLDPAVQFGLQFETQAAASPPARGGGRPSRPAPPGPSRHAAPAEAAEEDKPAQDEAAKVVSLDQFRKK